MRRIFIPSGGSVSKIVCHSIPPNTGWAQLAFLWQIRAFLWALSWSGFCYLFLHKTLIFFVFESHRLKFKSLLKLRISTKTCCNYHLWNSHHGFLRGYFKKIFSKFAKVCRSSSRLKECIIAEFFRMQFLEASSVKVKWTLCIPELLRYRVE